MKKLGFLMLMLALALMLASTVTAYAQTSAYVYGVQPGNQNYSASLGNDFTVNSPTVVTSLGSFASGGSAGFAGTITVGIYNTTTTALVVGPLSLSGNTAASAGTYDGNGDWFKRLPTAVDVTPGKLLNRGRWIYDRSEWQLNSRSTIYCGDREQRSAD